MEGYTGVSNVSTGATVTENEIRRCYPAMFEQREPAALKAALGRHRYVSLETPEGAASY